MSSIEYAEKSNPVLSFFRRNKALVCGVGAIGVGAALGYMPLAVALGVCGAWGVFLSAPTSPNVFALPAPRRRAALLSSLVCIVGVQMFDNGGSNEKLTIARSYERLSNQALAQRATVQESGVYEKYPLLGWQKEQIPFETEIAKLDEAGDVMRVQKKRDGKNDGAPYLILRDQWKGRHFSVQIVPSVP